MADKVMREKYGLHGTPTKATKAYRRAMEHDSVQNGFITKAESWILVTPSGQRCHLNTYDGQLGKNVDPAIFTYTMPEGGVDGKLMKKKLKGYVEVPVAECPVAIGDGVEATNTETETGETDESTEPPAALVPEAGQTTPDVAIPAGDPAPVTAPVAPELPPVEPVVTETPAATGRTKKNRQ